MNIVCKGMNKYSLQEYEVQFVKLHEKRKSLTLRNFQGIKVGKASLALVCLPRMLEVVEESKPPQRHCLPPLAKRYAPSRYNKNALVIWA